MYIFIICLLLFAAVLLVFLLTVTGEKPQPEWPDFRSVQVMAKDAARLIENYYLRGNALYTVDSDGVKNRISDSVCRNTVSVSPDGRILFYWQKKDDIFQLRLYDAVRGQHIQYYYKPICASVIEYSDWEGPEQYKIVVSCQDEEDSDTRVLFYSLFRDSRTGIFNAREGNDYIFPADQGKVCYAVSPNADWIVFSYCFPGSRQDLDRQPLFFYSSGFSPDRSLVLPESPESIVSINWQDEKTVVFTTKTSSFCSPVPTAAE